MNEIVTIGYSHKEAGATLDRLTAQGYHIIDIRLKPASRIPGYNQAELSAKYAGAYHWVSALGNKNYNTNSEYIALKDWNAGLERLKRAHDKAPLVLMCQCKYAEECHRWLVARDLQSAIPGLQVTHLLQAEHTGMIKHCNARTGGLCAWTVNGIACSEASYKRCARCKGDL
jgi:uncharacterized protein (DUF488 family)